MRVQTYAEGISPGRQAFVVKPTIKDIARLAEVSPSTVSRALHDNPRISEEVRQKVRKIATDLDFHPNQMARSLVNRRTRIVGVMFPGLAYATMGHPFYPEVLRGLGKVAGERRYHMLLSTGSDNLSDEEAVRALSESGYVSGLILLAAQEGQDDAMFGSHALPFVEIGHPRDAEQHYYVDTDNVDAGRCVTQYLIDRGHRRILFLGQDNRYPVTMDRRKGYVQALSDAGLSLRERWCVPTRFIENTTDSALLASIFTEGERPTAVVSMDDNLSIGLISYLGSIGLSVPQDVSIVSFNNSAAGLYASPPLTTVDVDPYRLGEEAMTLIIDMVRGYVVKPTHVIVPYRLIERDSVRAMQAD